jgi:hypothetical protein
MLGRVLDLLGLSAVIDGQLGGQRVRRQRNDAMWQ